MQKTARLNAEEKFAAAQKKVKQALKEKEKVWQERAANIARLKALRLAKEAADKEAAEKTVAEKAAAKNKEPSSSPSRGAPVR